MRQGWYQLSGEAGEPWELRQVSRHRAGVQPGQGGQAGLKGQMRWWRESEKAGKV